MAGVAAVEVVVAADVVVGFVAVLAALRGVGVVWHQRSALSPAYFSAAKTLLLASDNSSVDSQTSVHSEGALVSVVVEFGFEVEFVTEVEIGLGPPGPEAMTVDSVSAEVVVVSVAEAEAFG